MMRDYALCVEPFAELFQGTIRRIQLELATVTDEESAILNLLFLQQIKRQSLSERDPMMTRYYFNALQQGHLLHHNLRPTFRRAERVIYAREQAIRALAINACLLELEQTALEQEIPSTYLHTLEFPEFVEIESMENPLEYATRDALLLEQLHIRIWERN